MNCHFQYLPSCLVPSAFGLMRILVSSCSLFVALQLLYSYQIRQSNTYFTLPPVSEVARKYFALNSYSYSFIMRTIYARCCSSFGISFRRSDLLPMSAFGMSSPQMNAQLVEPEPAVLQRLLISNVKYDTRGLRLLQEGRYHESRSFMPRSVPYFKDEILPALCYMLAAEIYQRKGSVDMEGVLDVPSYKSGFAYARVADHEDPEALGGVLFLLLCFHKQYYARADRQLQLGSRG